MKKQIRHVSVIQTAKVFAFLYLLLGVFFVAIMAVFASFSHGPRPPIFMGFMLAMPIFYMIFGFIFTVIGAWIYNLIAGWTGGIEFTLTDVD